MRAIASPNIAFIKYWGKLPNTQDQDRNLATNPSLSMTLSQARTETSIHSLSSSATQHHIVINNRPASEQDHLKVTAHVQRILEAFEAPPTRFFNIESNNNFPQGTGIASSASAFAALTLATCAELLGLDPTLKLLADNPQKLSALARRGSGSACRSLEGGFVKWQGDSAHQLHTPHWPLLDTILIFSDKHKSVPSSEGHALAQTSPAFAHRLAQIPARLRQVESALQNKDLNSLGAALEIEALELHEIARSSTPSVVYLTDESAKFVQYLSTLTQRNFYFTLDAGPNVHLISEDPIKDLPRLFKEAGVSPQPRIWSDRCGDGPQLFAN